MKLTEPRWQFLINPVKSAIGEDGDDIAWLEARGNSIDDCIGIRQQLGLQDIGILRAIRIKRLDDVFRVQPLGVGNALLLIHTCQNNVVGQAETRHQFLFKHLAA